MPTWTRRSRIKHFAVEAVIETYDRGAVPLSRETLDRMLQTAYGKIGNWETSDGLLREMDAFIVGTADQDPPNYRWFLGYKRTPFGNKICYTGHDGSREARAEMRVERIRLFSNPALHYYSEASGRVAEILEQEGVPKVPFWIAQQCLPGKKLRQIDQYRYERNIKGNAVEKTMYGYPRVLSPVRAPLSARTETTAATLRGRAIGARFRRR